MQANVASKRSHHFRQTRKMDGEGPYLFLSRPEFVPETLVKTRRKSFGAGTFYFDNFLDFDAYLRRQGLFSKEILGYAIEMKLSGNPMCTQFYKGNKSKLILMHMEKGTYGVVNDDDYVRAARSLRELQDFMRKTHYAGLA